MGAKFSQVVAGILLVAAAPASSCDWEIASDKVDPMTDERVCIISSESAKIALAVKGDVVMFLTTSAYSSRDGLQVRVDENKAIYLGEKDRTTSAYNDNARRALAEIRAGERLRTSFRDYPSSQEGDAPICTLPELIDSCLPAAGGAEAQ